MSDPDRSTGIPGDQIKDRSIEASELDITNLPEVDGHLLAMDVTSGQNPKFKQVDPSTISTTFGSEFHFVENTSVIVTTNDVFQNVLDLTTSNLPSGNYKIEWSYGWNYDSVSTDFHARLALDNDFTQNNLIMEHNQEPSDSSGNATNRYIVSATDQLFRSSGFRILNLSGIKNFKLDFRTSSDGDESSIWDATITLYRVS